MAEVDLMRNYPKSKREITVTTPITDEQRKISRQYGQQYFDGALSGDGKTYGYSRHQYNQKYWSGVVTDFSNHYRFKPGKG